MGVEDDYFGTLKIEKETNNNSLEQEGFGGTCNNIGTGKPVSDFAKNVGE